MRKSIALLILFASFISCKKEKDCSTAESENLSVQNSKVVAAGNLSFTSKPNTGSAKVYEQRTGKYVLGLEKMSLNTGHYVIYLSTEKTGGPGAIKVFSTVSLEGDVFHELPAGIDYHLYKYLIIVAEPSEEIIASAELH